MKNIQLEIHEDEKFEFFKKFDTLSKLQKKIFNLAVWWVKRFPNAHPNQATIAAKCGCRREHVNRTFATFKKWGWLGLLYRGRRLSKTLLIPKSLVLIDVVKREYFARLEITSKRTHSYSSYRRKLVETGPPKMEGLKIPELASKLQFSLEGGLKLALLPEHIQQEALYQAKKLGKRGFKPQDEERYFLGIAFGIAEKQHFKPDWKQYYAYVA